MERGRDQESLVIAKRLNQQKLFFCFWKERVIVPGLLSPTAWSHQLPLRLSSCPASSLPLHSSPQQCSWYACHPKSKIQRFLNVLRKVLPSDPSLTILSLYFCYANYTVYFGECCMCFVKKKKNVWFTSTSSSWLSGFQIHSVSLLFSCLVVLLIIERNVLIVPMMFVHFLFVLWCFQLLLHEVWDFISCAHTCDCYLFKIELPI